MSSLATGAGLMGLRMPTGIIRATIVMGGDIPPDIGAVMAGVRASAS